MKLTEQQLRALSAFLNRVSLQGREAFALAELIAIIDKALDSAPKESVLKKTED